MKLREAIKVLRENTMACWWPNGPYPGKRGTDWEGIAGEVRALTRDIKRRQDVQPDAMGFFLDPNNPETELYNQLITAWLTVKRKETHEKGCGTRDRPAVRGQR